MAKKAVFLKKLSTEGWSSVDAFLTRDGLPDSACLRPLVRLNLIAQACPFLGYSICFDKGPAGLQMDSSTLIRQSTRVAGETLQAWLSALKNESSLHSTPVSLRNWRVEKINELQKAQRAWLCSLVKAHALNLVHADIRMSNLLLGTGQGQNVVLDWEPAVLVKTPSGFFRVLGNDPAYQAISQPNPSTLLDRLKQADLQVLQALVQRAQGQINTLAKRSELCLR